MSYLPDAQGLYNPEFEHDACGVAFVADLSGKPSRKIVDHALTALANLDHRGAVGAEEETGDGAGILIQVPHEFLADSVRFELPKVGHYAVGMAFLPQRQQHGAKQSIEDIAHEEGLRVLGWREVPVHPEILGSGSAAHRPQMELFFVTTEDEQAAGLELDRLVYAVHKRARHEAGVHFASLSSRTLVYKGMLTTEQLPLFFDDLNSPLMASALGIVHSRFSTNTFPSWPLAHPFRYIAHNGEINTARGNRNWMRARESLLQSDILPGDISRLFPICDPDGSDTASLDEVLELLHLGGRSLPHAVSLVIPPAWENDNTLSAEHRAFAEFNSTVMEPWDGPAAVCFTDGSIIGATLDRNGLRPARYWVTNDGLVVLASEVGVLDLDPATIVERGRVEPGRMFVADLAQHRIIGDSELKDQLSAEHPYQDWLDEGFMRFSDLPTPEPHVSSHASVLRRQQVFGWTQEEVDRIVTPMAATGTEAIGSMGTDTPIAALGSGPRPIYDYFVQHFAQVTNPPLDAIREELVTSLGATVGAESNLLSPSPESCRVLQLPFPVMDNDDFARLRLANAHGEMPQLATYIISGLYERRSGGTGFEARIDEICSEVSQAVAEGARIIVLSDRHSNSELAPIPSLLLTAAVHHHMVRERLRAQASIVVESGDAREVHHIALLVGFGATVVNPYLALETAEDLVHRGIIDEVSPGKASANLVKSLGKGVLKVMSKMGVSTVSSYTGAQLFECLGLSEELVDRWFTGTRTRLGGIGINDIAKASSYWHRTAYPVSGNSGPRELEVGGEYQWRRQGSEHLFDPHTVFRLQHSTRTGDYQLFGQYTSRVNDQSRRLMTLRGLLEFADARPISIDEVEPISEIVKRFSTGAMSYGSISQEAHEVLAIAMNKLGARSNTGEGGEDPERLRDPERRSSIKQVASGRFGVTSEYLTNADDIQIKMAQGAKPGEGGQLPGSKVYPWIAKTRHATPGVGLISPPPHHDIYSIEDLKQLIHDLKNANPQARVHVKLVAQEGVGTVAAGVVKAKADVVLISGHDGGTGAAPLTSLKHAGGPWELGLAETQQTLLLNGLRDRVVVQCDGQLKTGRDVIVAALLGAEEFGFATAPLVVSGCVMMRVCHLDTCPVGVATQNKELRARFTGKAEYVVRFFEYIAQEVRELLASLGLRSIDEAIGRVDLLNTRDVQADEAGGKLDLSPILYVPHGTGAIKHRQNQDHGLDDALDQQLMVAAAPALLRREVVAGSFSIKNVNRTVGTMLGNAVTKVHGLDPLPNDTIDFTLTGAAGQSFGAFLPQGVKLTLVGEANDHVGKGLSGGTVVVRPHDASVAEASTQIIAGNVIGYGATSGRIHVRGRVGERFCVRNSGASAVVEGTGDHALEYMTGGVAVILGPIGRNAAAGMSGGAAFMLDAAKERVNPDMVDLIAVGDREAELLHGLVQDHADQTGSLIAAELLADWPTALTRFTHVRPKDLWAVEQARLDGQAKGLTDEQITDHIMEVAAHG